MSISAEQFNHVCYNISFYFNFLIYFLSVLLSIIAVEIMRQTQGFNNLALLLLLINIFVESAAAFLFYYWLLTHQTISATSTSVFIAAGNLCHWIITVTYIQVSYETKMLLKKDTYLKYAV
jgi:hypothetical protein